MKLSTIFLIIIALQFNIILFSEGTAVDSTPLLVGILNPSLWDNIIVWTAVTGIIAAAAVTGSFVGSLIVGKNDLSIFALLVAAVIGWLAPIVSLWNMIRKEALFGTTDVVMAGVTVSGNTLLASVVIAPLLILSFWSILNWWRTAFAEG